MRADDATKRRARCNGVRVSPGRASAPRRGCRAGNRVRGLIARAGMRVDACLCYIVPVIDGFPDKTSRCARAPTGAPRGVEAR
jgi:hypothetical protein